MKRTERITAVAAALATMLMYGAAAHAQPAPQRVALTGGTIIPVVGDAIDDGVVLIDRGKIAAVGKAGDVEIPYDAKVIDVAGKVVFPGQVCVHTSKGMDITNESRPVTPHLDAADAIDPSRLFYEDMLRLGVTAIHVMPGENTVIGGVGQVVRPIGLSVAEMTIADGDFMKLSVSPRGGYDRMRQMYELRQAFADLDWQLAQIAERRYEEVRKEKEKPIDVLPAEAKKRGVSHVRTEDIEDEQRNLLRLTGGRFSVDDAESEQLVPPLGAFVYAGRAMDVSPAIAIAKDHGFLDRAVLVLGGETFKAMDALKQAARPVVLPPDPVYRERHPLTGELRETFLPKKFADAGLLFALSPGPEESLPERMLTYQAARCVRDGLPRDVALRAITINPATMLGLEARLGSIEVGKDANLAVFSGDPLDFTSVVERVIVDGVQVYVRDKDPRLQRMLGLADIPNEHAVKAEDAEETAESGDSKDAPTEAAASAGE